MINRSYIALYYHNMPNQSLQPGFSVHPFAQGGRVENQFQNFKRPRLRAKFKAVTIKRTQQLCIIRPRCNVPPFAQCGRVLSRIQVTTKTLASPITCWVATAHLVEKCNRKRSTQWLHFAVSGMEDVGIRGQRKTAWWSYGKSTQLVKTGPTSRTLCFCV
jgi:hypothetical protein